MSLNTETNEMKTIPSKVKGGTVTNLKTKRKSRTLASAMKTPKLVLRHINDLTDHPLNDILYDKDDDPRDKLRESLLKSLKKTGVANKETCKIDKNGVVYSGHRRKWASEEDETGELGFLQCVIIDHTFDPESLNDPILEEKEIELLDEYNEPDITRNQTSWPVLLRKYNVCDRIHFKKTKKYFTGGQRNLWCAEKCSKPNNTFKLMVEIYEKDRHDLINKVEKEGYGITKAWKEAMDTQPVSKLKYDPDRKNWVQFFKDEPECRKRVVKYANDMFQQYLNINVKGRKIPEDEKHGHEKTPISGNLSHFYMSALSLVLEEEGFNSITPREEQGLPDVRILNLSKPGCHFERLEVKVAGFNGHGSKTSISGGPGATRIVPHTFLLVVYDPDTKRQMVVLSDLTKEDWTANSKNTKCEMGMNIWADNHLDNCVFFHGEGFIDSKNIFNINLSKVD